MHGHHPRVFSQELHKASSPFAASVPTQLLPHIAFVLLAASFLLAFYFTTLPKRSLSGQEIGVALTASVSIGFGVIALFCAVGVYV
ncbi:hypothetical protein K437DRAFT_258250 [Tilletiaria anomala UBC 951]|uniref:Dolichyl-diphosphooligosaccharide-protein glycosyltransferase subunit OST5 n=1 Tax=Tilletiaria anomala (strain ATCC 24038 / CBS 436.72 / UBC 951) TaxID=1037660 RepID=A0A066VMB7_TILAU|nr:uncharacterized protein K437DRAFT_258250 [Tilletiaria anomala UBC 951]KDN41413.1 hypothetical protein K437DRAFT_258250 [Tilletiaria anomala UBC 951]